MILFFSIKVVWCGDRLGKRGTGDEEIKTATEAQRQRQRR